MAIKGAIFLSKSIAVKGTLVKFGAYMLTTKGVAATASAGLAVATAAGYFVAIKSIPENSIKGFTQIVNGLSKGSTAEFMDGLYKLSKVYRTSGSLISDFYEFVDASECDINVKISLKKSMKGLKSLVMDTIENKSYALLEEIEDYLESNGMSTEEYSEQIEAIYDRHTYDLYDNYKELLGRGGRIYSDIRLLNNSLSIGVYEEYDHYLVYCIAGWMIDNLNLECLMYKSQRELAKDITDQIFEYLSAYKLN